MATLTVNNLTSSPLRMNDMYVEIPANGTLTTANRRGTDLSGMDSLQKAVADGDASYSVTYSSEELLSGMVSVENSGTATDAQAETALLRASVVADVGGGAQDTVVFAAGSLPYKMRVIDCWGLVSTGVAGSWEVRDEAAEAGTVAATLDSTSAGRVVNTAPTASVVLTPGATKGLFIDRSDNTAAGEVFILVRKEV